MGTAKASLFRVEAVAASRDNGYGPIRISQPISNWIVAIAAALFGIFLLIFVAYGEVEKKSLAVGITQPVGGSLAIVAQNGGVLVKRLVSDGERVRAGQPIFEVSTARQSSGGELTGLIAHQIKARQLSLVAERHNREIQDAEKRTALAHRLTNLSLEEIEIVSAIDLAKRRRDLGQKSLEQYVALHRVQFASSSQLQEKQENLIDLDSRVSSLMRTKVQLQANRLNLETERSEHAMRSAADLLQLDRAAASLQQELVENENRRSSVIVAPAEGTLSNIAYKSGQGILSGQVLATLLPGSSRDDKASELEIHLYVPSRTAGFVAKGQQVFLRYQAYAYQKFGLQRGVVTHVGETPFAPNELPTNIAATILGNTQHSGAGQTNNEALYRITVRPELQYVSTYGNRQRLKPGMSLTADVIQEKRLIWEWIVDPIRALQGHP